MSVRVGSARNNENGGINGGAAGDQTGKEVAIEKWYLHTKGWKVIRAKDSAVREKIAHNMESICANDNIGYCQDHRATLTTEAKPYGYDASKVKTKVEVDCSEAVRNCVLYAGITVGSFNTTSEATVLVGTKAFEELTDSKYCNSSDYLLRGDILVTKTKGHTVVVLDNGSKADSASSGSSTSGTATAGNGSAKETTYMVVRGDTLSSIAARYGTTYQVLAAYNGIANPNRISVGQQIRIPPGGTGTDSAKPHTVVKGDTLSGIARKYGTTIDKIVAANKSKYQSITASHIVVGWDLTIPQ